MLSSRRVPTGPLLAALPSERRSRSAPLDLAACQQDVALDGARINLSHLLVHGLGWENVFIVEKPDQHAWPDFERPSDLAGVVFSETTRETDWRQELTARLRAAQFLE